MEITTDEQDKAKREFLLEEYSKLGSNLTLLDKALLLETLEEE